MSESERDTEHILVVDDDARVRQMLSTYFEDEGFRITAVADGAAMRECLQGSRVDLILLDLVLPKGEDGLGLAREIRARSAVPIIMLTGRGDVVDRIVGLEVGADDYIAKPFHLREVLARVRTVLRRHQPVAAPAAAPTPATETEVFRFDGWSFDLDRRKLTAADGTDVVLTTGEFDILAIFVKHPGRVFARETLMNLTRGRKLEVFDRTIDAQIARLRKKIEVDSKNPALIKSVRGVGYVFTGRSGG